MKTINKGKVKTKGTHILTKCKCIDEKSNFLSMMCEKVRLKRESLLKTGKATMNELKKLYDEYRYYVESLEKLYKLDEVIVYNITCTVGRSVLAQRLCSENTYSANVNYTALGDNTTAATESDATLGNEVYRKGISAAFSNNEQAWLETFFTATEVTGTFEEYGMFIDGTASADTGQLFNRFLETKTKAITETLNVRSIIDVNDA